MPAALRRVMISRKKLRYKELCATPARAGETSDERVRHDEIVARLMVLEIVVGIKMYFYHPPFSVRQRAIYFSPTSIRVDNNARGRARRARVHVAPRLLLEGRPPPIAKVHRSTRAPTPGVLLKATSAACAARGVVRRH